jgi:tetratricopeptide (TPR) repeat protein
MDQNEITERALTVPEQAKAIMIKSNEDYVRAGEILLVIKDLRKEIDSFFDPICKKAFEAHKEAVAQKKRADAPLVEAEGIIKPRIGAYLAEQEKIRQAEETRLREVARKEEEDRRLLDAIAAEQAGEKEEAAAILDEKPQVAPIIVPKSVPKVSGVSTQELWDFEITNESLIPRQYLTPDIKAIGKVVDGLKSKTNIPGVRVFSTTIIKAGRRAT